MLKTLLKYEFRATARTFLACYAALMLLSLLVGTSIIGSITPPFQGSLLFMIFMAAYLCLLMGIFVFTFVCVLQRFYRNLLGSEGYLMNTLPVKSWQLVASKLIAGLSWYIASFVVACLSILFIILVADPSLLSILFEEGVQFSALAEKEITVNLGLLLAQAGFATLLECVAFLCLLYASCMVGHQFNRHRVAASVGAYFLISLGAGTLKNLILPSAAQEVLSSAQPELVFSTLWGQPFWITVVTQLVLSAVYFGAAAYFLDKRLNLE